MVEKDTTSTKSSISDVSGLSEDKDDIFSKFEASTGSKSILLLQFQPQMMYGVILGIFISYTSCLMDVTYVFGKPPSTDHRIRKEELTPVYYIVYVFDVFYIIDVTFMILYKRTKWSRTTGYTPRHTMILILEAISIIPIDMVYKIIASSPSMLVIYCLRLRYALRLVRIYTFLTKTKKYIGEHSYLLHLVTYFGLMFILLVAVSCASYIYECRVVNITCTGENFRAVIGTAMYHSSAVLSLVGSTGYLPNFKLINSIVFSLTSYIINMYFIAFVACDIMHSLKIQFVHLNMYTLYIYRINRWKIAMQHEWRSFHRKYEQLVKGYGELVWWKTKGQLPELYLGRVLPPIMYKEIFLDISWEPLKHTQLFRNEDVFFLRAISQIMRYKFLSQGQVIYKRHKYKNAMIYIVSGVVQILSEEDCETPIMTLTSGSVFGESSLFINAQSNSTTVSKDVCEVAILYRKDFIRMVPKLYPDKYKRMRQEIIQRYDEAMFYRDLAIYQFNVKNKWKEKVGALSTKWLNITLRSFLYSKQKLGDLHVKYYLAKLEKNVFCAKYLNLIVKADEYQLVSDSVFVKNTFPFIFKDHSVLLKAWGIVVLVIAIILALTYPYFFVFSRQLSASYSFFFVVTTIMWWLDVYIRSSTVVNTKHESHTTSTNIFAHRISDYTYVLDILAAVTPEFLLYMNNGELPMHVAKYACANRLLKVYRVHTFFANLRANSTAYVYLKYIKKLTDMLLCVYYFGTIIFLLLLRDEASEKMLQDFMSSFKIQSSTGEVILCCFAVFEYYGNLAVIKFPYLPFHESYAEWIVIQVCLYLMNLFFVTTFIAMETLNRLSTQKMDEFMYNLDVTMKSYRINKRLKARVWRYINLQYEISDHYFYITQRKRQNLPYDLNVMTCGIKVGRMIRNQPLFLEFSDYIISHISTVASIHLLPATEVIKYAGEVCTELHILVEGLCQMKLHNGGSKSVEPGECFFVLETYLNIPSLVTIVASTNCKIITIGYRNLKSILLHYPVEYDVFEETANYFRSLVNVENLQMRADVKHQYTLIKYKQPNVYCFGYRLKKRTKRFYKFHEGFPKWTGPLKYILLRYCFYSNGKHVFCWEISRSIFALATNILFPLTCLSKTFTILRMILIVLDILAVADLYIRHHFSYFNTKGIEVTHPYKCAKHYWKYGFLVDCLGCLCINEVVALIFETDNYLPLYLNRILQLYRAQGLYKYIFRNNVRYKGPILMLQILVGTIVMINIITGFAFIYFCSLDTHDKLACGETWISKIGNSKYDKYANLMFFVVSGLTYTSSRKIQLTTMKGIYFYLILLVVGYVAYNVILAKIVAHSLTINKDLMSYQEKLRYLITYLRYKKIDKHLKKELINHFEYMWYKTKAKDIRTCFEIFKTSFKVEALYNIYGSAFKDSKIFPPPNGAFFKSLLSDIKHEIYLKTGIIYSVNDVSGDIFLLLRGRVGVVGADGKKLTILHVGSIFGNLDNCPLGRRTLKMVAYGHVELLRVSSTVFHSHLSKFPFLNNFFHAFGRVIRKRGLIALRYTQKTRMFYYDLATILPFELVALFFMNSDKFRLIWAVGRFNRIPRIFMVMSYLKSITQKLSVNVLAIKGLFFLMNTIIAQITLATLFIIVTDNQCKRYKGSGIIDTCAKLVSSIKDETFSVYSALVVVATTLLCKSITIAFIAECCSIFHVVTRTRNKFEDFMIFMKRWMKTESVSLPLADRLSDYINLLWNFNGGHQYPTLLNEAPYYLKEAVLNSMFGLNLLNHPALRHCHKDLLRQITFHIRTLFFFPGDCIVYIGDIDNCMYFIQEGEVQALSEDTMSSEVVAKVLYAGEMFGFNQGLYQRCGHEYTYKVTKFTAVIYLKRDSWIYLLDFFPASKYLIYKYAEENPT
ncbi:hypothetical protein Trydic_g13689 [Trypoxylus dichotomus]